MSLVLSNNSPPHNSQRQRRISSCSTGLISSSANHNDTDSAKRVSFHSDVDGKRISASVPSLVTSETSFNNAILLAEETKHIFSKLKSIPENNRKSIEKLDTSFMSQQGLVQGRFFGLDALQDLDNAVNGSSSPPSESSSYQPDRQKKPRSKMGLPHDSLRRMAVENNYHYDQPSDGGSRRRGRRDSDFMSTAEETSSERVGSYSNKNNSPYRSPTRTYFTDSEILRSPSEVLFAVSDKPREDDNSNIVHSSSQTLQSELMKRRDSHPHIYDSYHTSNRRRGNPLMSTSLDAYNIEEDKENSYKTRIHVISPDRQGTDSSGRKPYKTTINTANDNIHYRQEAGYYDAHGHYKVPRNKPVYNARYQTDSDSSARYYASRRGGGNPGDANNNHFNSTRLVKHIETSRSDRDREGREISRRKGRTYSGCSTSPDREGSVERYSRPKPIRSYSNLTYHSLHQSKDRSPSSSPTRPYRSKSSQNRDERSAKGTLYYRSPSKTHLSTEPSSERLSKFTEYRGEEETSNYDSVTSSTRRRSSVVAHNNKYNEELVARERGQSLPPGASIDSMGDFYKSNQYKSMYTLPPSPNRPAPILDRMNGGGTLSRKERSKSNLESIYHTDDSNKISRPKIKDSKRRAPSPPPSSRQYHVGNGAKIQIKRSEAPSDSRDPGRRGVNGSSDRPRNNHPSSRRTVYSNRRRQSVDGTLDSSYSESDGMIGDNDQNSPGPPWASSSLSTDDLNEDQEEEDLIENEIAGCFSDKLSSRAVSVAHLSTISSPIIRNSNTAIIRLHPHKDYHQNANLPVAFTKVKRGGGHVMFYDDKVISIEERPIKKEYGPGRRYVSASGNSDLDSDYRRELATHSRPSSTLNRSKKPTSGSTSNINTKSLDRRYRERHPIPGEIKRKLSPPSREEERRKVLEIERIHRQKTQLQQEQEQQQQQQQRSAAPSRSGSRLGRVLGIGTKKTRHLSSDGDSQYTGGSPKPPGSASSSTARSNSVPKINRYDQNTRGVKRNSSSSQFGVRREIHNRKKIPGSLTSSINSSESEGTGSGKAIILHNTAVAEIPIPRSGGFEPNGRRTVSESRENIASNNPSRRHLNNVSLQKSQKISRSISLLTPWKPRNYKDKFEGSSSRGKSPGKPPRPPSRGPSSRTGTMQRDKKSASSSDLLRDEPEGPATHHQPPPPRSTSRIEHSQTQQSTHSKAADHKTLTATNSKVSRSVSMPKNSRLSGWFKKRK